MWTLFVLALAVIVLLFSVIKSIEGICDGDRFKAIICIALAILSSAKIGYIVYALLWM